KGKPSSAARMKAAETVDARLFRGHLQVELSQPFGECPVKPFRFPLVLEGADKIIRKTDDMCLSLTVWFDHPFKPVINRIVEIDVRQNRRDYTSLRSAGLWVYHGP